MRHRLYKTVNDHRWAYLEHGDHNLPRLFIVHGMVSDADVFAPLTYELAHFFRVIIPDLPGYGRTTRIMTGNSYQNIATEYAAFVRSFGSESAHFVGISAGGGILLELALKNPELVNKYILNSPFLKAETLTKNPVEVLEVKLINLPALFLQAIRRSFMIRGLLYLAEKLTPPKIQRTIREEAGLVSEVLMTLDIRGNQELMASFTSTDLGWQVRRHLFRKPLFLVGEADQVISLAGTSELARQIGAPLVVLKGENHNVAVDCPRLFAEIVVDYILNDCQTDDARCRWC